MTGAGGELLDTTESHTSRSESERGHNGMKLPYGSESRVSGYEEFGGMLCPTCHGTGRIPRGQEDELVALIPYRDGRLKPRRTWLWVGLSILGCSVLAAILCFVLIPRDIKMSEPMAETTKAHLNKTEKELLLEIDLMFNVTNNNYVPVTVKSVDVEAQIYSNEEILLKTKYQEDTNIHSRSQKMLTLPLNISIDASQKENAYILTICDPNAPMPYPHLLYLTFELTMYTHLLNQVKENSMTSYPIHVSCVTPNVYSAPVLDLF